MDAHNIHPDKKLAAGACFFVCGGERDRKRQTGWGSYHQTDTDGGACLTAHSTSCRLNHMWLTHYRLSGRAFPAFVSTLIMFTVTGKTEKALLLHYILELLVLWNSYSLLQKCIIYCICIYILCVCVCVCVCIVYIYSRHKYKYMQVDTHTHTLYRSPRAGARAPPSGGHFNF